MEMLEFGDSRSTIVLIQPADDNDLKSMESEIAALAESSECDWLLRVYRVGDWNKDLSPWKAPAVFGKQDFGDGARQTLDEILKDCTDPGCTYYIGGYSLAGLFALWSAYQTDAFAGVAAASPSIWFPGFTDYMREHDIGTRRVYLSLGDRESNARNPVMATVADRIREAYDLLLTGGVSSVLEWNEGNHFRDPDIRTAKAFSWVIEQDEK